MKIKNNNGFTLIEILLVLAVTALVSTAVTSLFLFGYESFNVYGNYSQQQDKITHAIQLFRKDFEDSMRVVYRYTGEDESGNPIDQVEFTFPDNTVHKWRFEDNALKMSNDTSDVFRTVIENLIITETLSGSPVKMSYFNYNSSEGYLILAIRPAATNIGKYQGNNVKEPVITEFSLKYKYLM